MVTADAAGNCPRCGTPAPRISSASSPVVARPGPSRWLLPGVGFVAVALGVLALAPRALDRLRHPSDDVSGEYSSPHLGLKLSFPDGWRHSREHDRAPSARLEALAPVFADALSLRSSHFFRGGTPSDPDAEIDVVVGARTSTVTDAALEAWGRGAAAAPSMLAEPVRELTGVVNLALFRCQFGTGQPHNGLRCAGAVAGTRGELFVWGGRSNVELVLYLSEQGPEAAAAEASELVNGLER